MIQRFSFYLSLTFSTKLIIPGGQVNLFYSSYIISFEAGAIQINLTILFAFDQEVLTLRSTTNLTDLVFPMVTMCNLPNNSGEAKGRLSQPTVRTTKPQNLLPLNAYWSETSSANFSCGKAVHYKLHLDHAMKYSEKTLLMNN